jgi:hypothetical protein
MSLAMRLPATRDCEACVSLALRVREELAPRLGELDQKGRLRILLGLLALGLRSALRLPFRRCVDDHLDDGKAARPAAFLIGVDEVVDVAKATRRPGDADLEAFLDQRWTDLVDRLAAGVVILAEQDNLGDVGRKLDVSEAADAKDRDTGPAGSLHGARDGLDAFADKQGRAGLNIVGQKDDAAFVGPEGATLIFLVDLGLAPVGS